MPHKRFSPVTPNQVAALQTLTHATFIAAYKDKIEMEKMLEYLADVHSLEKLAQELADPDISYFFVEHEGQNAGFIMLRSRFTHDGLGDDPITYLNRFYLLPEFWGSGLAVPMMQFCEDFARLQGSYWLWLQVWQENARAIAFYHKTGFEHFGFMPFYLGDEVHNDWVMRKKLL